MKQVRFVSSYQMRVRRNSKVYSVSRWPSPTQQRMFLTSAGVMTIRYVSSLTGRCEK